MAKQRSTKRSKQAEVYQLNQYREDQQAVIQGPQHRKSFHVKDLVHISPKNENQEEVFHLWNDPSKTALSLIGCPGTGKTYLSLYLALREVLDTSTPYDKVVIIRSTVSVRSSGFLPGELEDKLAPFETPYIGICDELFPWKKSYENLKRLGKIEFHSTEFLRGINLERSIVIVDEVQNNTWQELMTIATRIAENSRIIFSGDTRQNDLIAKRNDQSGLVEFLRVLENMDECGMVEFGVEDIVRSGFVRSLLKQAHLLGF